MPTAAQLREALYGAKEQFDGEVFGESWIPQEQRLVRWNAFLKDAAIMAQALKNAEQREARILIRQANRRIGAGI